MGASFNAATANSPWRTSARRAPRGYTGRRFNAATANSPWRTGAPAGPLRPRKELQCGHGEFAVENRRAGTAGATRRPALQCGHGEFAVENQAVVVDVQVELVGFNAATANSPWRTRRCAGSPPRAICGFNAATANSPWRTW